MTTEDIFKEVEAEDFQVVEMSTGTAFSFDFLYFIFSPASCACKLPDPALTTINLWKLLESLPFLMNMFEILDPSNLWHLLTSNTSKRSGFI